MIRCSVAMLLLFFATRAGAVELTISLYEDVVVQGQPLLLRIQLSNETAAPLPCAYTTSGSFAHQLLLRYEIYDEAGELVVVRADDDGNFYEEGPRWPLDARMVLEPGESIFDYRYFAPVKASARIEEDLQSTLSKLLAPGVYSLELRANRVAHQGDFIPANMVTFEVKAIPESITPAVLEKILRLYVTAFYQRDMRYHQTTMENANAIVATFPELPYTRDIEARLLKLQPMRGYSKEGWPEMRSALIERRERFVEAYPEYPFADDFAYQIAILRYTSIPDTRENLPRRIRILDEFLSRYPESELAEIARSTRDSMEAALR